MRTTIYWIRRECHKDIMTEGYVGITNDLNRRLRQHRQNPCNLHLRNAFAKYKDLVVEEYFVSFDREYAKEVERELRSKAFVGWNKNIGGDDPPDIREYPEAIKKISKSIKALGVVPYCKDTHSSETLMKRSETYSNNKMGWFHNPETLEYKMIKTAVEPVPTGWVSGRVPKALKGPPASRIRNVKTWELYVDGVKMFEGQNLKNICREMGLLSIYPNITGSAKSKVPYRSKKYGKTYFVREISDKSASRN